MIWYGSRNKDQISTASSMNDGMTYLSEARLVVGVIVLWCTSDWPLD